MRYAISAVVFAVGIIASPAYAQSKANFNIPAQRLDAALIALGEQAQISIGGIDARLSTARGKAVRGRLSISDALTKLLRETGFDFILIDARTVRVIRAKLKPPPKAKPVTAPKAPPPAPPPLPPDQPSPEIIITASKQQQSLDNYSGSVFVEKIGGVGVSENLGTAAFIARIPTLTSTNLGPGRNKIFIRGIADSSFSGPTQSTVGLYLGDLRLTYNAPEPDLRLYDIDQVEVIEGPQGTLYGAGALGGIIRIIPNSPDLGSYYASASGGVSTTKASASGYDIGGTANVPIVADHLGLRIVGYRQVEGGYINDLGGKQNVNRSLIRGSRATLRLRPGDGWTIDLGGVIQNIDTRDSQYAERGLPPRTHASNIDQPHDNDFKAADIVIAKKWDQFSLISSTGVVQHDLSERFDATGYQNQVGALAFDESNKISLITHETRLSHKGQNNGTWVAGVSALRSIDRIERMLGPLGAPISLALLRDEKQEYAIFGETTQPISSHWSGTIGARVTHALSTGELIGGMGADFEPKAKQTRFLPTAALSWKPRSNLLAFLRYQSGFRSGGIAVSSDQLNSAERFDSDEIDTVELGARLGGTEDRAARRFSAGISVSYSRWRSIQADLISADGLPFTTNIGNGTIYGVEANGRWHPSNTLTFDGAFFYNHAILDTAETGFGGAAERRLPNVAKAGGRLAAAWERPIADNLKLKLNSTVRYVGASRLGTTPSLILEQGEYAQVDASAGIDAGAWRITLDATNVLNVSGNSFSYGNPFSVALGQQITPLRPRTLRLGVLVGF
jgi:iron complex outermembrane recepter protein